MKFKMKRFISLVLVIVVFASFNITSYANESVSNQNEIDIRLEENMRIIENMLEKKGTSVSEELNIAIANLEIEKQRAALEEDKEKLQSLINSTKNLQRSYNNYKKGVVTRGINHPVLTPAVAAVATFFSSSGYRLSFELLVHAQENNVLNSNYSPHYGDRILSSPVIQKIKQSSKDVSGSASFENSGTQVQKDLYYAIHAFNYKFTKSSRRVSLTDRYDFAYGDYEGIAGAAIDTMWMAQEVGVIVPYYVKITV